MLDIYTAETVVCEKKVGTEFNGAPKFGPPEEIKARVQYKRKLIRDNTGREVVSEITVYTQAGVETGDRLTIDGSKYTVLRASTHKDIDGTETFREVVL